MIQVQREDSTWKDVFEKEKWRWPLWQVLERNTHLPSKPPSCNHLWYKPLGIWVQAELLIWYWMAVMSHLLSWINIPPA
jgi:hypothetical protein